MSENHLLERGLTGLHIRPGKQVKTAAALSVLLTAAVFSQAARAEENAASSGADASYASVSEAEEADAASEVIEPAAAGADAASAADAGISSGEDASAAETVPTELDGGNFEDGISILTFNAINEQEQLYVENEWNFIDSSLDVSGGISDNATGRLADIRDNGVLTVATEPYFAPQEFIDGMLTGNDRFVGADMELARRIAERMGVQLKIVPLDFTKVLTATAAGTYDLAISALAYTPLRASTLTLSKGYYFEEGNAQTGLLIREEDAQAIKSIDDLAGKDIAAQKGSLQEMLIVEHVTNFHQFRRLPAVLDVYEALSAGEIDAAASDIDAAERYIENNPGCGLVLLEGVAFSLEEPFKGDRIAAKKGEGELISFVNGVIDEVLAADEYNAWYKKYSDYAARLGL